MADETSPHHNRNGAGERPVTTTTNNNNNNLTSSTSAKTPSNKRPHQPHSNTTNLASASPPAAHNSSAAPPPREFQRAYKACVPCRKRKARCEVAVPPDGSVPGPPCTRCKRALRECVFTEERAWKKQRLREEGERQLRRRRREGEEEKEGDRHQRSPPRGRRGTAVQQGDGELADSMIRTVVASGSDALNLLFEAATRDGAVAAATAGADESFPTQPVGGGELEPVAYVAPGSNVAAMSPGLLAPSLVHLSAASDEVLDLWKSCRFVRMGWFTAREAVTYIDL